jgi:hypothetical protein
MSLVIDSIALPDDAAFSVRQTLDFIQARTLRRSMSGALTIQSRYLKLTSTITGSGWIPDGLDGLDLGITHIVKCIQSLSVFAAANVITIPRAYRSDGDYVPQGVAIVAGASVVTPAVIVGNVATLTTVSGASAYGVVYYPIMEGAINISRQFDDENQLGSWSVEVEEK